MKTLKLVQPPGIRSTGGVHVPIEVDATKTRGESDFVRDLKYFCKKYGLEHAYKSIAIELTAIVERAKEGTLTYDERSSKCGTVCQIKSQPGVLEARLETTTYGDKSLYVRLFFSEPEDFELILLLGTLFKEDFPVGKDQQNLHAGKCQARGDAWITSRT
ncbi:MAG: hypothetical protein Q4E01_04570 [Actinomycetaceae bacterium]|nr:hypothetical protein [Actinomycetaceae bacterium]